MFVQAIRAKYLCFLFGKLCKFEFVFLKLVVVFFSFIGLTTSVSNSTNKLSVWESLQNSQSLNEPELLPAVGLTLYLKKTKG